MNRVLGFCNLHDTPSLGQLTKHRPIGVLSFLSRYGLMDFTLSNFSNSEIDRVVILAENNATAILSHTQQGYVWINNTKTGYLRLAINEKLIDSPKFNTDLANIKMHYSIIHDSNPEYIIIAPSFFLMSLDFRKVIEAHEESGAEASIVYTKCTHSDKEYLNCDALEIENNNVINRTYVNMGENKKANISLETFVFNREAFDKLLEMAPKVSAVYGVRKMLNYIINHHQMVVNAYEYDGFVVPILSANDYVNKSFELLSYEMRQKLFHDDWPIYTTTHNTPPALYGEHAQVKNSFVANGAIIKGKVENSIISRDVVIEEGAEVKNCIIFTRSYIGKDAKLEYVLTDKNVRVEEVKKLQGEKDKVLVIKQGEKI